MMKKTRRSLADEIAKDFHQAMDSAESDGEEYAVAYAARLVAKTLAVQDLDAFYEACAVNRFVRGRQSDLRIPGSWRR